MKKRYVGVFYLTPEGEGVIQMLPEELKSDSLVAVEHRYKTIEASPT